MFDYQETSLFTGKDTPNLAYLTPIYTRDSWTWYNLDLGVESLKVGYSEPLRELRVKGSIPYYWQGHNAAHSLSALRECWNYIEGLLSIKLFGATVTAFEYGVIVGIAGKPSLTLEHHTRLSGFESRAYRTKSGNLTGKEFLSPALKVKLYDPIANYKAKRLSKAEYTRYLGLFRGNDYLRIENHYKKPERCFKNRILLTDFFNPHFQSKCKDDLMETYNRIDKTKVLALPNNKSKLSTGNILLATLQSTLLDSGISAEELFNKTLSRIPSDVLTKDDRKARQKQFKKMLREIQATSTNPYDLAKALYQKLYEVEENIRIL